MSRHQEVIRQDVRSMHAYAIQDSRGLVNLKSGQTKNAIADFDAALKINPRLTSSLYGRGLAKKRNGSLSEGDLDINNAKAMDPNIAKEYADYGVQ